MNQLAPICLFTYNRLEETKQTIAALQKNFLAKESELYVFSDGAKNKNAQEKIDQVRVFLKTVSGFKSVNIIESKTNKGLANSIIAGVTQVVSQYGKVIVLEDDLVTSPNFLDFMNQGLDFYEKNEKIISICGYNMKVRDVRGDKYPYDVYFAKRSASWGWATWVDKWNEIDWEVSDYKSVLKVKEKRNEFNEMGSDMFKMLDDQQNGLNNSWAIRFCYHQFKHDLYSVYPILSKIRNNGFSAEATHTNQKFNRFDVELDNTKSTSFNYAKNIVLNKKILKDFRRLNSIPMRVISKIRNIF